MRTHSLFCGSIVDLLRTCWFLWIHCKVYFTGDSLRIYCGSTVGLLLFAGPLFIIQWFNQSESSFDRPADPHRTVFLIILKESCTTSVDPRAKSNRPTVDPQNPTGPQWISWIDLRAHRRSAVDPQTNTCKTVVPRDLTGRQWVRKIQRACSKSARL